jgi:hypothetical protein
LTSKTAFSPSKLLIQQENYLCGVNRNRELTGRYQGINLPDQGIVAGRFSGECGEMASLAQFTSSAWIGVMQENF